MNEVTLIRRIGVRVAVLVIAIAAFCAGLTLLNVRNDIAFAAGALLCVATPIIAGVRLWTLLREDSHR
ncbi:MAG: hypothetical protein HY054_02970 [Proteobacteria bacterium]|nr:hypothetical protein [Pseudomonadota bacterium]